MKKRKLTRDEVEQMHSAASNYSQDIQARRGISALNGSDGSYTVYNHQLAAVLQDPVLTLMLGYYCHYDSISNKPRGKRSNGYINYSFYKEDKEIASSLGISKETVKRKKRVLIELGLIRVQVKRNLLPSGDMTRIKGKSLLSNPISHYAVAAGDDWDTTLGFIKSNGVNDRSMRVMSRVIEIEDAELSAVKEGGALSSVRSREEILGEVLRAINKEKPTVTYGTVESRYEVVDGEIVVKGRNAAK